MRYIITFAATGGMTIEADSEEDARAKFDERLQEAVDELTRNGIDITGVYEEGD